MTNDFNFTRVWHHLRRDIVLLRSTILTALAICSALLFGFIQLNFFWNKKIESDAFFSVLSLFFIISGVLLTFSYFKEIHYKKSNTLYLTLPISALERIVAIWLSSAVLHTLCFVLLGIVVGGFSLVFGSVLFGAELHFVNMSFEGYWKMATFYLFLQPIFMFGASTFKKNRRSKTVLLVVVTALSLVFFNMALFTMLNHGLDVFDKSGLGSKGFELAQQDFSGFGKILFLTILGPVLYLATYFKIKEKEG